MIAVKKVFYAWRYYMVSREDYVRCMEQVFPGNLFGMWFVGMWFAVFSFVFATIAIVPNLSYLVAGVYVDGRGIYASFLYYGISIITILFTAYVWNLNNKVKQGKRVSKALIYVLVISLYFAFILTGTYMSVWSNPDGMGVTFMVLLICSIGLVTASPVFNFSLVSIGVAIFVISSVVLKEPQHWYHDIIHVSYAAPAAIMFNWFANVFKISSALNSLKLADEKAIYFTQCQLMQEVAEQVKAVRHDMKIHLATLQNFASNSNTEEIKSYLVSLVNDIEKSEVYSDTGNIAFDSIINYKLRNAKNENIKLDLSVAVPPELDVEVVDIVTIIGNLLDNALEAVTKTSEKFIKLDIEFVKGGLFAKVENSFNSEIKFSEEKQIISLKTSQEHGYGLKNIKQSVEKYNGYMEITHTENTFSTGVFLYVNG